MWRNSTKKKKASQTTLPLPKKRPRCSLQARKRQRIETLEARPHHPELKGAYALLVNAEHAQIYIFH
jgi:hypothetical protein